MSAQRRMDRYAILYLWKLIEKKTVCNINVRTEWKDNKGRVVILPKMKGTGAVRTLRENAFLVKSGKLFNLLPFELRNYGGWGATLEEYKGMLGRFLDRIPDRPRDVAGGWYPEAVDTTTGKPSNALIHWIPLLKKNNPEYNWNMDHTTQGESQKASLQEQ